MLFLIYLPNLRPASLVNKGSQGSVLDVYKRQLIAQLKMHGYQINADTPLEPFLIAKQQSAKLIEMLWEPLCLAALNTPIAVASTRIFLNVLRDSFTGHKKNSDFLIPKLDLSKILSNPLAQYIQANGGSIKLNSRISQLKMESDGRYSIGTKAGKSTFSHVIIATPPSRLDKLLLAFPKLQNTLAQTQTYGYQPIYTIYLQYPADTKLPNVMTGLTKNIGQWVFDRGQLCAQKGLISVIVSASGRHQQLSQEAVSYTHLDVYKRQLKYAHDLGLAFQLTNITRDVGEDARRNRIYLPLDELAKFKVTEEDILQSRESESVKQLLDYQIERAESYYDRALNALPQEDKKSQRVGLMMAAIYRTLLREIKADGAQKVLNSHTSLGALRKLYLASLVWFKTSLD